MLETSPPARIDGNEGTGVSSVGWNSSAVVLAGEWVTFCGVSRAENAMSMRECRLFLRKSDHLLLMRFYHSL